MPAYRFDWLLAMPASGDMDQRGHPAVAATAFMGLLAEGDLETAWPLAAAGWQRQQLQQWISYLRDPGEQVPDLRAAPNQWWWESFLVVTGGQLKHEFKHFDPAQWAAGDRPRPVGVDQELVVFVNSGGRHLFLKEGLEPRGPRIEVLMHLVDEQWLTAAIEHINDVIP